MKVQCYVHGQGRRRPKVVWKREPLNPSRGGGWGLGEGGYSNLMRFLGGRNPCGALSSILYEEDCSWLLSASWSGLEWEQGLKELLQGVVSKPWKCGCTLQPDSRPHDCAIPDPQSVGSHWRNHSLVLEDVSFPGVPCNEAGSMHLDSVQSPDSVSVPGYHIGEAYSMTGHTMVL